MASVGGKIPFDPNIILLNSVCKKSFYGESFAGTK